MGPIDQYTSNYEITKDPSEWKFVENLLTTKIIPQPLQKSEYPSGWKPPNLEEAKNSPYFISRTKNHMQPVYIERTHRGMRRITVISKIKGDIWLLEQDVRNYLENLNSKKVQTHINEVSGEIQIRGDHVSNIKGWMDEKGF